MQLISMMKIMNKLIRIGGTMALLWAATGCVKEDPKYSKPIDPETAEMGYLSLADVGLYVVVDSKTDQDTESSSTAMLTRAEGENDPGVPEGNEAANLDAYKVKISAEGAAEPAFAGTYAELKNKLVSVEGEQEKVLALPAGLYTISATSNLDENVPTAVQASPSYAGKVENVTVARGKVTKAQTVVCKLQNIKITVSVATDLREMLDPSVPIQASVYYGRSKDEASIKWDVPSGWDWTAEDPAPVYFPELEGETTLHFYFRAKLRGEENPLEIDRDISDVVGGQWRRIHVIPKYDTTGNLVFEVEVSAFVADDEITVGGDGATYEMNWTELALPEPSTTAPSIKWADGTDLPETITAASQQVTIAAPNGIKTVALNVSMTNPEFTADAAAMTKDDLCAVTSSRVLGRYGIPFGSALKDQSSVSFGLDKILNEINGYPGTYTFAFTVTDQKGLTCEQTLRFVSGGGAGPTIEWTTGTLYDEDGFNPDGSEKPGAEYIVMYENMPIEIELAAKPYFKSIKVKITAEAITDDMLTLVGLAPEFDMCNLQDYTFSNGDIVTKEKQEQALTDKTNGLGLISVVNEKLKGKSSESFIISDFVSMMQMLGPGEKFQFALTVEDTNGGSTTKYLRLQNPAE